METTGKDSSSPLGAGKVDVSKHPCFNIEAKKKYGRVHLPVAPKCNVQCNYCNRKFDCVNESRPGVSSAILSPQQSVDYLKQITKKGIDISVVGIAGPGDPLANADEVFETIRLAQKEFPEMLFCLSTNGVELANNIDRILACNISHVTITMNGLDPEMVGSLYSWIRYNKKIYRGVEAGKLIIERQLEGIELLKKHNIIVKINSVILPGYNDKHIVEVAEKAASMGADIMNCIPVHPTKDTAFEDILEPSKQMMYDLRKGISKYIKPMAHCARCRADAAGLLGEDIEGSMSLLQACANKPLFATENRPYVAAASHEGMLVNQHLGETDKFMIYKETETGYALIETRPAPPSGSGDIRWIQMAKILNDCNTVLVSGAGANPTSLLKSMGLKLIQMNGLIEAGLDAVYKGKPLNAYQSVTSMKCGEFCEGNGQGCG